jgi:gamma-glutamyltranspeptidase/glutathione hydrolase
MTFREPVATDYRGHRVISMPPPSSGGVALIQMLNILERFELGSTWRRDPGQAWHLVAEAMKHAFADRARHLGDSDFAPVPTRMLTSRQYASSLAKRVRLDGTADSQAYGIAQLPDDAGTSHFCIVDRWGNCVVATETVNTLFGSLAAVDAWGLILNNEMDDFTTQIGKQNAYGLRQSERNAVAPRKRPLSSMTPTIVLRDDRPVLLLGASGGPRIISSVLNVLVGVVDRGLSLEEAVDGPRLHHQWLPDEVYFDRAMDAATLEALTRRGHKVSDQKRTGIVQAIHRDGKGLTGASDPRKGGRPAGY